MKETEIKKWEDYSTAEKALIIIFFVGIILGLFTERPGLTLAMWAIICGVLFMIVKGILFIRNKIK